MIGVEEALERVLARVTPRPVERVGLRDCAGRVLAEDARAPHDSPPFDTSAMDGFAVRSVDLAASRGSGAARARLPIQSEVSAGDSGRAALTAGHAIRINTGAPLPDGADAVVRIEDVVIESGYVDLPGRVEPGGAVRRAGEDYRAGQVLIPAGRRIDARAIGALASIGVARPAVAARPRVAVLASGDEIVEPGHPLRFGQIYDSTRYALMAALERVGAEVMDLGHVADDPEAVRGALSRGFEFDFLITTGGVSMGSRDFIRPIALELGAEEIVYQVRQRPGKPLFIAAAPTGAMMFGLPGNPVSVMVSALVYVRAALLRAQGASQIHLPWRRARMAAPFKKPEGWTLFTRADRSQADARAEMPEVVPSPGQGSHQFSALVAAAGLIRVGEPCGGVSVGDEVDWLDFDLI